MVVIAVIAIIAAFAVPVLGTVVNGPALNQASALVTNQFSLARQYATTKNRAVELRLLRYRDPESPGEGLGSPGQFRAVQLLEVVEAGVPLPIGQLEVLPQAIVLCADPRSSLLDGSAGALQTPQASDISLPRGIERNYAFYAFRFLPNGATTLAANRNWFVTAITVKDHAASTALPANFFILQVDPVSGTTREFRPSLR